MTADGMVRLRELFTAACEMEVAERRAFLEGKCRDEPELLAEVLSLLDHSANSHPVLGEDDVEAGFLFSSFHREVEPRSIGADVSAGRRIGHYLIRRTLGVGGMGTVYEAEQQDPRRMVALKMLRPGIGMSSLVDRFRHEAHVLGRLHHPGIAQIYEAGTFETEEGPQPFIAMERIEGVTLTRFAEEAALNPRDRLALVAQVCDAVQHAHEKGIVHRDLKPANILVDPSGQPKILDFGVARLTDPDTLVSTMHTMAGQLIGTLPYMSPEQVSGDPDAVDARTDIYALGVILFELLAGRLPHDLTRRTVPEATRIIREEVPSKLGTIDSKLRGDVETIVHHALSKEPQHRYPNAGALAADLRRFLVNEPIVARPMTTIALLIRFAMRHQASVGAAVIAVLSLIVALFVSLGQRDLAVDAQRDAVREMYRARLDAATAALVAADPRMAQRNLEAIPASLRRWEWRYLDGRVRGLSIPFDGRTDETSEIARSAAGDRVLTRRGQDIVIWDPVACEEVGTIATGADLSFLARTLPNDQVAVGSADGRVMTFDFQTHQRTAEFAVGEGPVVALDWNGNGKVLVSATANGLRVWDGVNACVPFHLPHDEIAIVALTTGESGETAVVSWRTSWITPDGRPSRGKNVFLWDLRSGVLISMLGGMNSVFLDPRFSPDGHALAVGGQHGHTDVVDGRTLELRLRIGGHDSRVITTAWSSDGGRIVTGSDGGNLILSDVRSGETLGVADTSTLGESGRGLVSAVLLPDDGVVANVGGRLHAWAGSDVGSRVLDGHDSYVYLVAFSPDGTTLASCSLMSEVSLWDPLDGALLGRQRLSKDNLKDDRAGMAFSSDGGRLVLGNWSVVVADAMDLGVGWVSEPSVGPWTEATADAIGNLAGLQFGPTFAGSPDGRFLITARDGVIHDATSNEPVGRLEGVAAKKCSPGVAIHPTEPLVLWCQNEARVHDLATGRFLAKLGNHESRVYCAAFSPDGTRLATGCADGTVWLWDSETWESLLVLRGHSLYVRSLAWSPDGTMLASASGDKTVRIWDSVARIERRAQAMAARNLRDAMRGEVDKRLRKLTVLEVAKQFRSDESLSTERRRAALRVLQEISLAQREEESLGE